MNPFKVLIMSNTASVLIPNVVKLLPNPEDFNISASDKLKYYDVSVIEEYFDLIMIQYSYYKENRAKLKNINNKKVVILANFTNNTILDEILSELKPYHLIGLSDINAISDIKDYLLYIKNDKFWKASDLISEIEHRSMIKIGSSNKYQAEIDSIIEKIELTKCFQDFPKQLSHVLNEIVSNALYNAPFENGKYLYKETPRREKVQMLEGKEVEFEVLENDIKLVIAVRDCYGSLSKQDIENHINNSSVQAKSGGAGVGIYLAFRYCHKLIYNVTKSKKTEVIIVFNKLRRNKDYELVDKSFHYFEKEESI